MKKSIRWPYLILFPFVLLGGCSLTSSHTLKPLSTEIVSNTTWMLHSIDTKEINKGHLHFLDEKNLTASVCNTITAQYSIMSSTLYVKDLSTTIAACLPEELQKLEGDITYMLQDRPRVHFETLNKLFSKPEERLLFTTPSGSVFTFFRTVKTYTSR